MTGHGAMIGAAVCAAALALGGCGGGSDGPASPRPRTTAAVDLHPAPACVPPGQALRSGADGRPHKEIEFATSVANARRGSGAETTLRFADGSYRITRCDRAGHLRAGQVVVAFRDRGRTVFLPSHIDEPDKSHRYGRYGTASMIIDYTFHLERNAARARAARERIRPGGRVLRPTPLPPR